MSVRRNSPVYTSQAMETQKLRTNIQNMQTAAMENTTLDFESLTETEKSAATIGASPDEWKPISWMNAAHYTTLLKNNVLGGRLTQQIEAYKVVSGA